METVVCLSNKNAKPKDYVEINLGVEDWKKLITELLKRARTGFWGIDEEICGRNEKCHTGDSRVLWTLLYGFGYVWCNLITICYTKTVGSEKGRKRAIIGRQGKNWYAQIDGCIITVNASSYTIITAHKEK